MLLRLHQKQLIYLPFSIIQLVMSQRKSWTSQQDSILKHLYEEKGVKKWAQIARIMQNQYGIKKRSGKQCRQRYNNHLHNQIKTQKWTRQEQQILIKMHNSGGNRWAQISRCLTGRSQTCVKNKFYSILRRGSRYVNRFIKKYMKKYKEIQINTVFKLVDSCEHNYKLKTITRQVLENLDIKKQIIFYGMNEQRQDSEQRKKIKVLVDRIKNFQKKITNSKQESSQKQDEQSGNQSIQNQNQQKIVKTKQKQAHSEDQIDESQQRDDFHPIATVLNRKESFQRYIPQLTDKNHHTQSRYSAGSGISKLIVQLDTDTSKNFDIFEKTPRENRPGDWTIRSFDMPQGDAFRSPRQMILMDSPYFDQLRGNNSFNSFSQFYPQ